MQDQKIFAAAVVAIAIGMPGAAAAADLSAPGGAIPAYFAREIVASATSPRVLGTGTAATRLGWAMGYNFSSAEVRYMRVECSDTLSFDPVSAVVVGDPAAAVAGAINGLGSNVLTFSITSVGGPANNVVATDTLAIVGNHAIAGTYRNVDGSSEASRGGQECVRTRGARGPPSH